MTSYVETFVEATSHLNSPELFRRWGAISTVAGALERKVWVRTKGSNLYPNIYVLLVAPPGIGKTEITWRVRRSWGQLKTHHVASSSVTKASLMDELVEAKRHIMRPGEQPPTDTYHSLLVSANELGVLIPNYESEFMNTLTDLYDCKSYSETRRSRDTKISMERTHLNLLAACTPGFLRENIPIGAWDQGFLSRVILAYSGEQKPRSLFLEEEEDHNLERELKGQLKKISTLYGKAKFTPEAAQYIDHWNLNGQAPVPSHPRLLNYNSRRVAHLLKLSMVAMAATYVEGDLIIEEAHIRQAMNWLFDVEAAMGEIFKSMSAGGDGAIIEDAWHFLYTTYMKEGQKPVLQNRLVHFFVSKVPAAQVPAFLTAMEDSGMIKSQLTKGGKAYTPIKSEY